MKSILVTGGAGYIGSHTVKELIEQGKKVVVLDNLQKGHIGSINDVDFINGDIVDEKLVSRVIKEYGVESVIHFAADSLVGESMKNPAKYYYNNVVKTINFLNTIIKKDIKKIVFSSTAAVYGEPKKVPISEDLETKPTNVYGSTKLMIENILKDYDLAYGLKYVSLRYFNAAGAYEGGYIGEDHSPETHLIPIIMQVLLGRRDKIYIFGSDYNTKDGTCIRDYIHVTDLANAHILALEALEKGMDSNIYNLGCGEGYSVKEVIDTVEKVTQLEVNKEEAKRRPGDPAKLIASSERIKKELDWNPKYNLEDIIKTAWNWHKNNPNGFEK